MTKARRAAAIALCAGLAVGLAGQLTGNMDLHRASESVRWATDKAQSGRDGTTQAASSVPMVDAQTARMAAAQDLLSTRAAAVKARNKRAWMATVDPADSAFRGRQSVAFDNLIKLPLGQFSYGPVQPAPALAAARAQRVGPKAWVTTVTGTYSLAGFDRAPRAFAAMYTLLHRPDGWRIADDTDGVTALQMWDLPRLRVRRGQSCIVIGNAPEAPMRDYSAIADSAVRRVSRVWGTDWNAHVVIVTPSTTEEFAKLLLRSSDEGLDQVAAITQGVIDPGLRAQEDLVVINPKAFTALQPMGRRMVITHELTHVAARSSTTGPVPIWLTEGMADYVGYSGLDLPRERVASELLTLVRAGKGLTELPTEVDFDPSRTQIAPSYSESWLAVSRLVDLYGQAQVVAFYRVVAAGSTVDRAVQLDPDARAALAFPKSFGVTEAQFVDSWRRYLKTLAHTRG
ncbi:MAG: hypothetical protein IMZ75_02525 [Actinobacteria bacterium]|nr:hypothetical protein [Actinomycetota bacterium]